MRTRNTGVRPVLRVAKLTFLAATFGVAAGCGGGGGDNNGPSFTNNSVVTNPAPLTHTGGNASAIVTVTDPSGVMPGSVLVDIKDSTGASLVGGPQVMTTAGNPAGTFSFDFPVPNNSFGAANKVYVVTVTAKDTVGNAPLAPFVVGTVTVPNPPPPPGGP
jgi:hypothetical protein